MMFGHRFWKSVGSSWIGLKTLQIQLICRAALFVLQALQGASDAPRLLRCRILLPTKEDEDGRRAEGF